MFFVAAALKSCLERLQGLCVLVDRRPQDAGPDSCGLGVRRVAHCGTRLLSLCSPCRAPAHTCAGVWAAPCVL